ncbi:MAG: HAMP domain-containing histidine kinase, partial [Psychrosphaera sp.]|nr:HAMP domain-containing histidine kinase [Psychrosphaera sp.]
ATRRLTARVRHRRSGRALSRISQSGSRSAGGATTFQTIEKLLSLKEQEFIHVSHELRTPLTLVTGPIKSAYAKSQDDEVRKDLAMAARNGDRLHRMVDQLLHLERFKFTTILAKSPQNIAYILTTITESFNIYAGKKQISITLLTTMPSDKPYTMAFVPDAFEKILVNLLSNAVKYTAKNGSVDVKATVNADNSFTLSVKDSGVGIKSEDLQYIFDKFYRVIDQSSERETGAGVGLALVK